MMSISTRRILVASSAITYVSAVLLVDALASHRVKTLIDWQVFIWRSPSRFDLFKFIAWFLIPAIFCRITGSWDLRWYGLKRWVRLDWVLLIAGLFAGTLAIAVAIYVPSLRAIYGGLCSLPTSVQWEFVNRQLIWTFSWLIGWEFMHRYVLPATLTCCFPKYGWWAAIIVIPFLEGVYHLQKPPMEAVGMVLFSVAATWWVLKRRNALLPLVVHLAIEVELIAARVLT